MTETRTQEGDPSSNLRHKVDAYACILWLPGSGSYHDPVGMHLHDLLGGELVVPDNFYVGVQGTYELLQVVGEAVVVVHEERAHSNPPAAVLTASVTALALLMYSLYSLAGMLSATIPAPDLTKTLPFFL